MKLKLFICVTLALLALRVSCGEPAVAPAGGKPKPPFPEIPSIIWFEDFENAKAILNYGHIDGQPKQDPAKPAPAVVPPEIKAIPPEGNTASMDVANVVGSVQKWSVAGIQIGATGLKIPSDYKVNDLALHFEIWAEEQGEVAVQCTSKDGLREGQKPVPTIKAWAPITIRFSELGGRDGKIKPDDTFTDMKIIFRPKLSKAFVKAHIDNVMITSGTNKLSEILPMIEMARKRAKEIEKVAARDGFSYTEQSADILRTALKADKHERRTKTVLVVAPRRGDGPDFLKALNAATTKNRLNGYTFIPAVAPDESPVGGLEDGRMLFRYNIDKSDCEFVLLALSYADARMPGKAGESARIMIDRVIEAGCIPVVSVPPPLENAALADKAKIEDFMKSVSGVCAMKGVTMIECSSALKNVTGPLNENELSAAALTNLAGVCVQAIKHLDAHLLGRKQ